MSLGPGRGYQNDIWQFGRQLLSLLPNVAAKMVNVVTSYNGVIPGGGSGSSPGTSFQEAVQEQENQLRTVADRNGIGSAAD